jgi:hypothetical protein
MFWFRYNARQATKSSIFERASKINEYILNGLTQNENIYTMQTKMTPLKNSAAETLLTLEIRKLIFDSDLAVIPLGRHHCRAVNQLHSSWGCKFFTLNFNIEESILRYPCSDPRLNEYACNFITLIWQTKQFHHHSRT